MRNTTVTTMCSSAAALAMTLVFGCGPSGGHRVTEDEWDQLFGMPAENTKAASELVQRDAESRQQWLSLHEDLQTERAEIGHQRDLLEEDRRTWSQRERRDPIIAAAVNTLGLLAACSLPLILVAMLLWKRPPDESSEVVNEVLVEDLTRGGGLLEDRSPSAKRLE